MTGLENWEITPEYLKIVNWASEYCGIAVEDRYLSRQQSYDLSKNKDNPPDFESMREAIPAQVEDIKHEIANDLDLPDPSVIPNYMAYPILRFHVNSRGFGGTKGFMFGNMTRKHALELGIILGKQEQKGLIELCYEELLQRDSDGAGFKHYSDREKAGGPGNMKHDIVRDIELSPEARKLRGEL